jgi:potassium uptake TrkH family protein
MYSNKPFFGTKNRTKLINGVIRPIIDNLLLFVLLLLLIKIIIVVGFERQADGKSSNLNYHQWVFSFLAIGYLIRSVICIGFKNFRSAFILFTSIGIFLFFSFTLNIDRNIEWLNNQYFYSILIIGLFVLEFSRFDIKEIAMILNPAQLFMFSFAFLIITGATLLALPNSTTSPITFVDALFTSTSAICVTGLIVVDTATQFTALGKSIILMLIQIGGIGIMTFTSFFGFFFKAGSSSFSERFVLSEFFSEDNVSEIRKTLAKVVLITLLFEAIGAAFLYFNLDKELFVSIGSRIRFSVFHSVSAFCNAGFSTLTDGIYDYRIRGIYPILYVLSFLIILGGIGFPILMNLYTFVKYKFLNLLSIFRYGRKKDSIPMMINVNSRLVIYTTLFLIIVGTVFFFIFESDHTLKGMDLSGKIAHSFFGSVTPRTAGYNSVNMGGLSVATVVLTIFLMWVGASPVSTGGGIKTSTFAIAVLNAFRIARVKNHIEFHKREFHERSVDRAFSIIILSIVILGCSSLIMYLIEPDKGALKILFECVSAFGTVGLSLGITSGLTDSSKLLLILLMYGGRMGILTLLFAIFRKTKTSGYRYPKENIVIT